MKKKCIIHLTPSFGCGGLERVIANLVSSRRAQDAEHIVISLSDELSFSYALPENVKLISMSKKEGLDLWVHARLFNLLKKLKADVLHTYNFATLEYHAIAKLAGVKLSVHSDHGLGGDDPDGKNNIHNLFRKNISRLIDNYIVVSEDLKNWAINTVGVDRKKVEFIFNGVPVPNQIPEKRQRKENEPFRLLIVGRLAPVKNHKNLFEALELCLSKEINIHCDIVGNGPLENELKELAKKLNIPVTFHGHQKDVDFFIHKCDALILSSDYEAMPMTILEAMAQGRMTICPRVGGVESFITSKESVMPDDNSPLNLAKAIIDSISFVSSDKQRIDAYSLVSKKYSVETMADKYMSLYGVL